MDAHVRTTCRLCGSSDLRRVLSLPATPPANEYISLLELPLLPLMDDSPQQCFNLYWAMCRTCAHIQLPVVVDPERLFRNYKYVSGTSKVFVQHFEEYADTLVARYGLGPDALVVEIGSNDGTLLRALRGRMVSVLGVDPATEIAEKASDSGIPTLPVFFNATTACDIRRNVGPADIIVANNVFAHADDLAGMLFAVRGLLKRGGSFVFEVGYVADVIDGTLFDTIYHEHLSYHGIIPLVRFLDSLGFQVRDVESIPTHGGSIRVHCCDSEELIETPSSVLELIDRETLMGLVPGFDDIPDAIQKMEWRIEHTGVLLCADIRNAHKAGLRVAAFGAPAKATTLMYRFGLGADVIEYVIDDSPLKQGMYTPGKLVPIVPSSYLYTSDTRPDVVVILAWNFADSIMATHKAFLDSGGTFIVPLPHYAVYPKQSNEIG